MENTINALSQPVLSLCMIVKNERHNLPRCLASVKPYVDEIIVVDTGSQDGTSEIALQYGAKVENFEWGDDFASARNYAISKASGNWILMLDADEELIVNSKDFLEKITLQPEIIAYSLTYIEVNDQSIMTPSYRISLFRNISDCRYVGRYHEVLKYREQDVKKNQISHLKSLKILHYGFSKEQSLQKNLSRNIPMLERIRQEEGLSLKLLYCLSGMYAQTQQPEKAQECCEEAFEQLLPNLMDGTPPEEFIFIPSLVYTLAVQALQQKDYETARLLCQQGLEWCPDFPPLNYIAGLTILNLGFPLGAVAYFQKCIQLGKEENYYKGDHFEVSFITTDPACSLGLAYIKLAHWNEAVAAFELALSFDANCTVAKQNIEQIKQLVRS